MTAPLCPDCGRHAEADCSCGYREPRRPSEPLSKADTLARLREIRARLKGAA